MSRRIVLALLLSVLGSVWASAQMSALSGMIGLGGTSNLPVPDFSNFALGSLTNHYWKAEELLVFEEYSGRKVGDLTLGETKLISTRLALAKAKDTLLVDSAKISLTWPGAAQLRNGDTGTGIGFSAGNLAILGAGVYGVWALLPSTIKNDVSQVLRPDSGVTTIDYLPAAGVGIATWLIYQGWGLLAAGHAVGQTKDRLDRGELTVGPFAIDPEGYGIVLKW